MALPPMARSAPTVATTPSGAWSTRCRESRAGVRVRRLWSGPIRARSGPARSGLAPQHSHSRSVLCGAVVWARRALNSHKWWCPARAGLRQRRTLRLGRGGGPSAVRPAIDEGVTLLQAALLRLQSAKGKAGHAEKRTPSDINGYDAFGDIGTIFR